MQQPHLRSTVRVHCGRGLHTRTATGEAGEVRGRVAGRGRHLSCSWCWGRTEAATCAVCAGRAGWAGGVVRLVRGRLPGPDWPPAAGLVVVVAPRQLGGSTHEPRL